MHPKHPLAGAASIKLRADVTTNSLHLLRAMAKYGNYATLLPEVSAIAELNCGELVSVPIANAGLQYDFQEQVR